jgi:hypothetical protein
VGLKHVYFHLKTLDSSPSGNDYRLDGNSIVISDGTKVLALLTEENGGMELCFDRSCLYSQKIGLVKVIRKATAGETLSIGPDITIVELKLLINSSESD